MNPVLSRAWGPLLSPSSEVILVLATPPKLLLLPFNFRQFAAAGAPTMPAPEVFREWYATHQPLVPGNPLNMLPNNGQPNLGDVLAAVTVIRLLTVAGVPHRLLPEQLWEPPLVTGRNAIIFGASWNSEVVRRLTTQRVRFEHQFDPESGEAMIASSDPGGLEFHSKRDIRNEGVETYGLITVLASSGDLDADRKVIISGARSSGAIAAAEFFASTDHMRVLEEKLRAEGHDSFPPAYQVLVKVADSRGLPLRFEYAAHVVLD
jgi:hypothetical protein